MMHHRDTTTVEKVSFHSAWPEMDVPAEIATGQPIQGAPEWWVHYVGIGPSRAAPDRDRYVKYIIDTRGSGFEGGDEWRFDKDDLTLRGLILAVPEVNLSEPSVQQEWLNADCIEGCPRLLRGDDYVMEPVDVRAFDASMSYLMCLNESARCASGHRLAVCVAQDTRLLFIDGHYCGWILRNPIEYLTADQLNWTPSQPGGPSGADRPEVIATVNEYLTFVTTENVDRMMDKDPDVLDRLRLLLVRSRAAGLGTTAGEALCAQIKDLLDRFYDIQQPE